VLEGAHSRVESRIEERRRAVDAALRHIMLPGLPEEEQGREDLTRTHAEAVARMLELMPKRTLAPAAAAVGESASRTDDDSKADPTVAANAESLETPHPKTDNAAPEAEDAVSAAAEPADPEKAEGMRAVSQAPEESMPPPMPQVDLSRIWERPPAAESALLNAADATDALDAVLAEGGFLPSAGEA